VLAVELFETTDGTLLVNELAMRPHNSGHWTMDGAVTSQFEQHLRAVLDYPLGDTAALAPVTVMANVLGAPKAPAISSRGSLELVYTSASSGELTLAVSTDDLLAHGDYVVLLWVVPNPDPTAPQNCMLQSFMCGQSAFWYLTSTSCRFTGATKILSEYLYEASGGESISLEMISSGFIPQVAIYSQTSSQAVAADTHPTATRSFLTYRFPKAGSYFIAAISAEAGKVGAYTLTANCSNPGCEYPIILSKGSTQEIRSGESATLSVSAIGTSPLAYTWMNLVDLATMNAGSVFVTPPLFADTSYSVTVSNGCGSDTSGIYKVDVQPLRRRPVRR